MFSYKFFYKMPFILYCLFFIFFANQSFAKSLDITSIAKQVVIYDHQADQILFEKNSDDIMKPASMAKVMTSYIVFDHIVNWFCDTCFIVCNCMIKCFCKLYVTLFYAKSKQ